MAKRKSKLDAWREYYQGREWKRELTNSHIHLLAMGIELEGETMRRIETREMLEAQGRLLSSIADAVASIFLVLDASQLPEGLRSKIEARIEQKAQEDFKRGEQEAELRKKKRLERLQRKEKKE